MVSRELHGRMVAMVCLLWVGLAGCGRPGEVVEVTVSAAASLRAAVTEAAGSYMARRPGVRVNLNFGSSGTLRRQIEQGAPVDLFISADGREMDELGEQGLIDTGTRTDLLVNRIALVEPVGRATPLKGWADLGGAGVRLVAVGLPQAAPCGRYAQEVLEWLGLWEEVQPKLVFCQDVLQIVSCVRTGNVDAGIVFLTDSRVGGLRLVAEAPGGSHRPVVYPAAVLRSSRRPAAAGEFLRFLAGPQGRAIFRRHGFALSEEEVDGR